MKEDSRKVLKSMMMVTQLGIVMMVPIFLCGALGVWLNRLTGIDIIFPILLVLGIGSGFRSVYMVTKSFYASDKKKENEKKRGLPGGQRTGREQWQPAPVPLQGEEPFFA